MQTNPESEPVSDSSRPRERPIDVPTRVTPAARRSFAEDAPLPSPPAVASVRAQEHAADRSSKVQRFLRHRLTSPEKRTVKRVQAQRVELFSAPADARPLLEVVRQGILQILQEDRGLAQGLHATAYDTLVTWLVDDALSSRSAAEVVGLFLREVGAMERPELSAPRVKLAVRVLNEVLYSDAQSGPVALGVREFRLEKRDGGLQVVALLRAGADAAGVDTECRAALRRADLGDIDVRLVSRAASPLPS